jgi:hypothetical protein
VKANKNFFIYLSLFPSLLVLTFLIKLKTLAKGALQQTIGNRQQATGDRQQVFLN